MDRVQAEAKVKDVLVAKLRHHEITVDRAQEIARETLDTLKSVDESVDASELLGDLAERYEELAALVEGEQAGRIEHLLHVIANDFVPLLQQGDFDTVIARSAKVDECSLLEDDDAYMECLSGAATAVAESEAAASDTVAAVSSDSEGESGVEIPSAS